jgi:hypothetical protein
LLLYGLLRFARNDDLNWRERTAAIGRVPVCPTGKSPGRFITPRVQPHLQKYSDFPKLQISLYAPPSRPTEGRFAIVTDAGRDAVDAEAPITNGVDADGKAVWS